LGRCRIAIGEITMRGEFNPDDFALIMSKGFQS